MPQVSVYNVKGDKVGELSLSESIFGADVNNSVMHDAVVAYLASLRRGTHDTKERGEVRGGGRKPWRQKGTGRARQGSIRAPQWPGGGTVFGPTPRSYAYKLPKKVRKLALKSALSSKAKDEAIIVLDDLSLEAPKTKEIATVLGNLKTAKALIVTPEGDANVFLSVRNLPGVKTTEATGLNVYDILAYDRLILTRAAVAKVEEVLA